MAANERIRVDVILPAAGTSERMGLPVAKQFLKVLGKPILVYTVDSFHRLIWVRHIVVVVSPDQVKLTTELLASYGFNRVRVCAGSHTRHRSIFLGLQALASDCSGTDVVMVHDAARPFVPEAVVEEVARAAMRYRAAGVTRPLVSTVIRGDGSDSLLVESLDRTLYQNSEMPQAFHYDIITSAYAQSTEADLDFGTECLLLALKYCQCPAKLVPGTEDLWKITYQKDVYSMESVVKEKFMAVSIQNLSGQDFPAVTACKYGLMARKIKVTESKGDPANTFIIVVSRLAKSSLELVVDKIWHLYEDCLPKSAVRLDLMVVLVFLRVTNPAERVQSMTALKRRDKLELEWGNHQKYYPEANPDTECFNNNANKSNAYDEYLDQSSEIDKNMDFNSADFNCKCQQFISSGDNLKLSSESESFSPMSKPTKFDSLNLSSETQHFNSFNLGSETINFESVNTSCENSSSKHNVGRVHPPSSPSSSTENVTHSHSVCVVKTADIIYNRCECNNLMARSFSTNETKAISNSASEIKTSPESHCSSPCKSFSSSCVQKDCSTQSTDCPLLLQHSSNILESGHITRDSVSSKEIISVFKKRLQKYSRRPTVVSGVLCGVECPLGDQLAELVWQRSSFVDGQVLDYLD